MFGYNSYGGGCGVGGFGCGPQHHGPARGYERGKGSYGGSTFVLIVVLFILLIIVGCSFV